MFKKALRHLAVLTLIFSAGLTVAPTATFAQDWGNRDRNYQRDRGWDRHEDRRDWRRDERRERDWRRQEWRRDAWGRQRWNAPYYREYRPYNRGYVPRNGFYFGYRY
jgi:hypothetical protein